MTREKVESGIEYKAWLAETKGASFLKSGIHLLFFSPTGKWLAKREREREVYGENQEEGSYPNLKARVTGGNPDDGTFEGKDNDACLLTFLSLSASFSHFEGRRGPSLNRP